MGLNGFCKRLLLQRSRFLERGNFRVANANLAIEVNLISGNDTVTGSTGNDILYGGIGNDLINGGGGVDTAEYMGPRSDYSISRNADGSISVVDEGSPYHDGSDTLYGISYLQFSDQTDAISSLFSPSSAGAINPSQFKTQLYINPCLHQLKLTRGLWLAFRTNTSMPEPTASTSPRQPRIGLFTAAAAMTRLQSAAEPMCWKAAPVQTS